LYAVSINGEMSGLSSTGGFHADTRRVTYGANAATIERTVSIATTTVIPPAERTEIHSVKQTKKQKLFKKLTQTKASISHVRRHGKLEESCFA
jgi:hypothetical protein